MRLFLGVFPPPTVQHEIFETLSNSPGAPRLGWTSPERLHITLAFLGEVEGGEAEALVSMLGSFEPYPTRVEVELAGLGGFPDPLRARVLFLGVRGGEAHLRAWQRSLVDALPPSLRPREKSPFHPHLTLARPRRSLSRAEIDALEGTLGGSPWSFRSTSVDLVESILGGENPRYRRIARLGSGDSA